jgi:dihydroxyacetone kinase-like predicted kinase
VFERTADAAVDPGALVSALAATGARQVVLLPGAAGLTAVAEKAASTARGNGQEVLVMPTSSVLQGLAALAVHDPERRSDDDAVAMAEAAAGTRTGSLTVAETEALTWAGRCDPGDVLGVTDGEVVLIAPDLAVGALWLAHRMLLAGGELLTVLLGGATDESLAEGLVADLRRSHPEVDVVVHRGGPGGYPLELGVE